MWPAGVTEPQPGRDKESLDLLLRASAKLEELAKEFKIVRYELELAAAWEYVGRRLHAQGDMRGAGEYMERSLSLARSTAAKNPTDISLRKQLLYSYMALVPVGPRIWDRTRSVRLPRKRWPPWIRILTWRGLCLGWSGLAGRCTRHSLARLRPNPAIWRPRAAITAKAWTLGKLARMTRCTCRTPGKRTPRGSV